jgi:putative FmdB family regulatory protein
MPIYEYKCPEGHVFECFQRMADPPVEVCEVCGASPVERVLYPVAVHFKGSGFYTTDYGRGSRRGGKDGSGSDSDGGSDSGGSDSGGGSDSAGSSSSGGSDSSSSKSDDGGSGGGDKNVTKKPAEA